MGKGEKKPRSTPSTTSVTPSTLTTTLTSFSPASANGKRTDSSVYFAHLLRAPDHHTLRIYDVSSGQCVIRWGSNVTEGEEKDEERVASISWVLLPPAASAEAVAEGEEDAGEGKRGKKRRKSTSAVEGTTVEKESKLVFALGLESGKILFLSLNTTNETTLLSHPTSTLPLSTLVAPPRSTSPHHAHLYTINPLGQVNLWELSALSNGTVAGTLVAKLAGLPENTPWDDLALNYLPLSDPAAKKQTVQIVLSKLTLHVYSFNLAVGGSTKKDKVKDVKVTELGKCTGHIAAAHVEFTGIVSSLSSATAEDSAMLSDDEDNSAPAPKAIRFLSHSKTDRFVQIWSLAPGSTSGKLIARLGLESGVSAVSLGVSSLNADEEEVLAAVDAEGRIAFSRLPLAFPEGSKKVFNLETESVIKGKGGEGTDVNSLRLKEDSLVVCRGRVKPVFEVINFTEENGSWISKIELEKLGSGVLNGVSNPDDAGIAPPRRYSELPSSTARSGVADQELNSDEENELDNINQGELDVDLVEPTLAERLTALKVGKSSSLAIGSSQQNDDGEVEMEYDSAAADSDSADESSRKKVAQIPSATLTTTLIQALHSSDGPLLESCLSHTNTTLIRSTVKRLNSGNLVLNLLEVLVEKLSKGKKGKEGGAGVKRARGLIEWVRQVLVIHVGFLVTVPSLVTRLAKLHSSLTSRLALQPTLLSLNGRLELVMSQIELRQEKIASAPSTTTSHRRSDGGKKYVEGESSESDDDEMGGGGAEDSDEEDSEGSIEDVILGSDRSDDSEDDGEIDDGSFNEDDEEEGGEKKKLSSRKVNGRIGGKDLADLLDLEAEEDDDDASSDEDEEDDEDSEDESEEESD